MSLLKRLLLSVLWLCVVGGVLTVCVLIGCGPPPGPFNYEGTGVVPLSSGRIEEDETKQLSLDARVTWAGTGVSLSSGDRIKVFASGVWSPGGGYMVGPGGGPFPLHWIQLGRTALPDATFFALIGRIGKDGPPFLIGSGMTFLSERDGDLYLMMNESLAWMGDNIGTLSVDIAVERRSADVPPVVDKPKPPISTAVRSQHAVVVGISKYEHRGKWNLTNLRYAADDARSLAAYLKNSRDDGFDKVVLLTDKDATTKNIKVAIREKLRGVQKDDFVLIFWSGHGCPDPQDTKNLYLVTHDTDPEHMASTAYSMEEFKADIAKLKAGRVLVIADACHSAGIADPKIGIRGVKDNKIIEGIRGVYIADERAKSGGSMRMIFTSCETGEVSRESGELGGGHGVFTWYLLQALKGQADNPRHKTGGNGDRKVTLGEVIEYTRDKVKRHTGNQQHPDTAGRFDRNLIMGRVK